MCLAFLCHNGNVEDSKYFTQQSLEKYQFRNGNVEEARGAKT